MPGLLSVLGAEGFIFLKYCLSETLCHSSIADLNFNQLVLWLSKHSPQAVQQPSNDQPFPKIICFSIMLPCVTLLWVRGETEYPEPKWCVLEVLLDRT